MSNVLTREDAEEYSDALGQVVTGSWRQVALGVRLGVPTALGLSTREWVEDRLGGYVRLAIEDRREAVAELTDEGHSQRQAADILGVDHQTVNNDVRAGENSPADNEEPTNTGDRDPAAGESSPTYAEPEASSSDDERISSEPESEAEPEPRSPSEWDEQAQRESELRAARSNLSRALLLLTAQSIPPAQLVEQEYDDVIHEFDPGELDYAAATMTLIAERRKDNHA